MNKIKTWALAALVGFAATGCDDTLMENVNPDAAHQNTCELGLPVLVFYASQVNYDHAEYGIYLSQCLTTTGKSQTGSYAYKSGWQFLTMNRHPQWRRHFYDIGKNALDLQANAEAIGSPNYSLIARTIMLMSTQLTTDMFGDIPRSEAYQSNSPHYDTQSSIYNWMLNEEIPALLALYEDPAVVEASGNKPIDVTQDRIYAGDLQKWKGLVYAIRARLLLRNIPNVNTTPEMCDQIIAAAQQAIDQWQRNSGDVLYGDWFGNEPRYNFDGGITESNAQWSSSMPKINTWESRSNDLNTAVPSRFFMEDCLGVINQGVEISQGYWNAQNGYGADPRLLTIMKPNEGPISASNTNKRVMYRYLENNIGGGSSFKQANYPDLFKGAYAGGTDAYTPLFTMEELYFIQAEAYYWKGEKAKACELVREATEHNCQRHLDRFQRDNAGAYPKKECEPSTSDADKNRYNRIVDAFFDNVKTGTTKPAEEIGNKHWFFNPSTFSLSDLMIQKYISMYMQPEQWTDMRRYHYSNNRNAYGVGPNKEIVYPTLRRPYNLYSAFWVDGLSEAEKENCWVQRVNYDPETEEKYNLAELERLGASKNHLWLRKPMIWAEEAGVRSSLTQE